MEKKEITVNSKFIIKVKETNLTLTKEEAEQLFSALFSALGKTKEKEFIPYYVEKWVKEWPWFKDVPSWKYTPDSQPYIYCSTTNKLNVNTTGNKNYVSDLEVGDSMVSYCASPEVGVTVF
jgi:hypothetical protein